MGSKPKVCKCGHDISLHKGKSKFSVATFCQECPCSSYMNRKRPFKYDYGLLIMTVILAAIIMIASTIMIIKSNPELDGTQNNLVTFTAGELYDIMVMIIIFANLYLLFAFVLDPIIEITRMKKRKEFPPSDPDEL